MEKVAEFSAQTDTPTAKRPSGGGAHVDLSIGGMTCRHCPPMVEKALEGMAGVHAAQVNVAGLGAVRR